MTGEASTQPPSYLCGVPLLLRALQQVQTQAAWLPGKDHGNSSSNWCRSSSSCSRARIKHRCFPSPSSRDSLVCRSRLRRQLSFPHARARVRTRKACLWSVPQQHKTTLSSAVQCSTVRCDNVMHPSDPPLPAFHPHLHCHRSWQDDAVASHSGKCEWHAHRPPCQ